MLGWWRRKTAAPIPDALWLPLLARYRFIGKRPEAEREQLRALAAQFIATKRFSGAHGLEVTDEMAVAVAAQAVLPVLHLGLAWYDDFVGIVLHPADAVARRTKVDEDGVEHKWSEVIAGEAMHAGPVTLSWPAVRDAGDTAGAGFNVVIHEFAHKLDMRDGASDGCPPLPARFMGARGPREARRRWMETLDSQWHAFREQVTIAERFGGTWPWLDPYGATAIEEFFAVTCEAYFVYRDQFAASFPVLLPMYDAFFVPKKD